jgi:hypothetical protein
MLRSLTNDAYPTIATNDLATAAHLFNGSANFHKESDELANGKE